LRKLSNSGYLVWKCYIYVFLCYWIIGLDEGAGYGVMVPGTCGTCS